MARHPTHKLNLLRAIILKQSLYPILDHFQLSEEKKQKYFYKLHNQNIDDIKKILRECYKNKHLLSPQEILNRIAPKEPKEAPQSKNFEDLGNNTFEIMGYIIHRGKTPKDCAFSLPKKYQKRIKNHVSA